MPKILAVLLTAVLLAAGCGNDTGDAPADAAEGAVATRIVSLSATATEMLFAIGAGDQVIAVDSLSNYPAAAPVTDLQGFEPSVEAIAELEPDLVVLAFDPGDVVDGFGALDIETLVQPSATSLSDAYADIAELGAATGRGPEAEALVAEIMADLDEIVAAQPERDTPLTFFHEIDSTLYSLTSSSFAGEVYAMLGLINIADAADDGSGFPQLGAEYVIDADPDLIFLADALYGESAATVAERPGWASMSAVQQGHIIDIDADIASRWGPRLVELAQAISDAVAAFDSGAKATEPADG